MPDADFPALCTELASLYRALGATIGADIGTPDRSSTMRPALDWCTTHTASHRRDEWSPPCVAGRDPRGVTGRAAGATLTPTAPRSDGRRGVPGSRPPLDLAALAAQEQIWMAATELAADCRHALGHVTVDGPMRALQRIPALLGAVADRAGWPRWAELGTERLGAARDSARRVLDLDPKLTQLGPCPNTREPYAATWFADDVPAAMWDDGQCRRYDPDASIRESRAAGRIVDVWVRAHLWVDASASAQTVDGDITCRSCKRRWSGETGRAALMGLMAVAA